MPHNYFDERIAKSYEDRWPETHGHEVVAPMVDLLAHLGGEGPVLEFAIGTGRIALPLAARGMRVDGIELSPDMVAQLRKAPDGERLDVTLGDMATTRLDRSYRLVYLVANTIMNLTTQAEQVACFENASAHLEPGGVFVVEVVIPALQRLPPGETVVPFAATPTHVGFEEYDVTTQVAYSHHWWNLDGRFESFSAPFRYVWPSELDLMARIAGMELRDRWAGWDKEPFMARSRRHVSVWEKPAT
ncbi:MAG: class I SAM-dependent methyltransferase [Acidimicrobiales bacterium]|nr:class I SAM-dependent methyltransferase [Acidimicrobiales bacterium]